jgi:hypothetical protein
VVRAVSSEGFGRMKYYQEVRRRLDADRPFRRYFEQETNELPEFFVERIRRELGALFQWLPAGAMLHDPHAYLNAESQQHRSRTLDHDAAAAVLPARARELPGTVNARLAQ